MPSLATTTFESPGTETTAKWSGSVRVDHHHISDAVAGGGIVGAGGLVGAAVEHHHTATRIAGHGGGVGVARIGQIDHRHVSGPEAGSGVAVDGGCGLVQMTVGHHHTAAIRAAGQVGRRSTGWSGSAGSIAVT